MVNSKSFININIKFLININTYLPKCNSGSDPCNCKSCMPGLRGVRAAGMMATALLGLGLFHQPAAGQASAQTPAQSINEGLRRQEERVQDLQQRIQPSADTLQTRPAVSIPDRLPLETPCFAIRNIELTGPDATRFGWLADTATPYLGQCAGVAGLRQIAAALDAQADRAGLRDFACHAAAAESAGRHIAIPFARRPRRRNPDGCSRKGRADRRRVGHLAQCVPGQSRRRVECARPRTRCRADEALAEPERGHRAGARRRTRHQQCPYLAPERQHCRTPARWPHT